MNRSKSPTSVLRFFTFQFFSGGQLVSIEPSELKEGIHQLVEMVGTKAIDGFILDRYELMLFYQYYKNDKFYQHDVEYIKQKTVITEISKEENYAYGILIKLEEDYQFLVDFLFSNIEVINTCNRLFLSKYSQKTIHLDQKVTLFSSKGEMFWPSFVACTVLILICMGVGGVYELQRKGLFFKGSSPKSRLENNHNCSV